MTTGDRAFHVLIVDDSSDVTDSLAIVFNLRGMEASKAYDAQHGLALARARRPDAVILDLVLPDTDGYALAQALRHDPSCRDVVLVAYTGDGTEAARERCAAAGIDVYVLKPIDPTQLVDIVTQAAAEQPPAERHLRLVGVDI